MPIYSFVKETTLSQEKAKDCSIRYLNLFILIFIFAWMAIFSLMASYSYFTEKHLWESIPGIAAILFYLLLSCYIFVLPLFCYIRQKKRIHALPKKDFTYKIDFYDEYCVEYTPQLTQIIRYCDMLRVIYRKNQLLIYYRRQGDLKTFEFHHGINKAYLEISVLNMEQKQMLDLWYLLKHKKAGKKDDYTFITLGNDCTNGPKTL